MPKFISRVRPLSSTLFVAAIAVGSLAACDSEDPRGVGSTATLAPQTATTEGPDVPGMRDSAPQGGRTSTMGRAYDAAERTRDRVQQRDAETGEAADQVFE